MGTTGGRLRQDAAEEVARLRTGRVSEAQGLQLSPNHASLVNVPCSKTLDIVVTFERGSSAAAGLLLRPWLSSSIGEPASAPALIINWELKELQVWPCLAALLLLPLSVHVSPVPELPGDCT